MNTLPITEADLQAWVDATLPEARRAEVDAYLAANPAEAERLAGYRSQTLELRALYNPVLDEPIPPKLGAIAASFGAEGGGYAARPAWQRIAAGVAIALLGGLAGWMLHDRYPGTETLARSVPPSLAHQAAVAHAVFSPDVRRPVEVTAQQEDQLVAWLSKRLGTPVRPPRLAAQGFELVGGRLLPGNAGPVAQFMYQDASGQRMTLYVSTENTANRDTAFRFAQEGGVNVFYWIDGKFGYALTAAMDKGRLAGVATAVYDQIERR